MKIKEIKNEDPVFSPDEKSIERRAVSLGVFLSLPTVLGLVSAQGNFITKGGRWISLEEWVVNKYKLLSDEAFNQDVNMSGNKALKLLREKQEQFSGIKDEVDYRSERRKLKQIETKQKLIERTQNAQNKLNNWLNQDQNEWMDIVRPKSATPFITRGMYVREGTAIVRHKVDILDIDTIELNYKSSNKLVEGGFDNEVWTRVEPWEVKKQAPVKIKLGTNRPPGFADSFTMMLNRNSIMDIFADLYEKRRLDEYLLTTGRDERVKILRAALLDMDLPIQYDPLSPQDSWVDPNVTINKILNDPAGVNMDEVNNLINRNPELATVLKSKINHHTNKFMSTGVVKTPKLKFEKGRFEISHPRDISEAYIELQKDGIFNPHGIHAKGGSVFHSETNTNKIAKLIDDPHTGLGLQERTIAVSTGEYSQMKAMDKARFESSGLGVLYDSSFSSRAQADAISKMMQSYDTEIQKIRSTAMSLFNRSATDTGARQHLQFLAKQARNSGIINSDSVDAYMKFIKDLKISGRFDSALRGRVPFKTFIMDIHLGGSNKPASVTVPLTQFGMSSTSNMTRLANSFTGVFLNNETQSGAVESSIQAINKFALMASKHVNDLTDLHFKTRKFDQVVKRMWGEFREKMAPSEGTLKDVLTGGKLYSENLSILSGQEYNSFYRYMDRGVKGLEASRRIGQNDVPIVAFDFEFNSGAIDRTLGVQKSIRSAQNKVYWMAYNVQVGQKEQMFNHYVRPENWMNIREHVENFHAVHQQDTGYKSFKVIDKAMKVAQEQFELDPSKKLTGALLEDGSKVFGTIGGYVNMAQNIYNNTNSAVNFLGHNIIEADLAMLNKEVTDIVSKIEEGRFNGIDQPKITTSSSEYRLLKRLLNDTKPETLLAKGRVLDTMTMTRALLGEQKSSLRFGLQDIYDTLMTISVAEDSRLVNEKGREAWNKAMTKAVQIGDKAQQRFLIEELPSSIKSHMRRFISQQSKDAVLDFFDKTKGSHHSPFYDTRLSMLINEMAASEWDRLERDAPETFYKLLELGKASERQLESGGLNAWHHNITSRTNYDLLNIDDPTSGDVLRSSLFSMTPVQATKGVGSFLRLENLLPFGALSNFQKQKYQALSAKLTDAAFVEDNLYDVLNKARVPGAMPIVGRRLISTVALEDQERFMETFMGKMAGTAYSDGKVVGSTRRLRHSFPAMTLFLPNGHRLAVEDQALFTSKDMLKSTFNFGKGVSQPIMVETPGAKDLMTSKNFGTNKMTVSEYMKHLRYSQRVIDMIDESGAGATRMSSFIDGSPLPVYSHQEAIDMLNKTTTSKSRILSPGEMFLDGTAPTTVERDGQSLVRMNNKIASKIRTEHVITSLQFEKETGNLIFDVLPADQPTITKITTSNKMAKSMVPGVAANEFVGKGVNLIMGWKGDAAATLDAQMRRVLLHMYKSGMSVHQQKMKLANILHKAFGIEEKDIGKVVDFEVLNVHKNQTQYFGEAGQIVTVRLKNASLLNLQHRDLYQNISLMLKEAGISFDTVRKNFKHMFQDVGKELGVNFQTKELDRLADLLVNEQKKQINTKIKASMAYDATETTMHKWMADVNGALKSNTALFDIGVTVQKSQIRSYLNKYMSDRKVVKGLSKDQPTVSLFEGKQLRGDVQQFLSLEPFAFMIPNEVQVMEDVTDFGRIKGVAKDIYGNPTEHSSSIWQMMMFKQAHQNNPVFKQAFLYSMLSKSGYSDVNITNQLKSNYFSMNLVRNAYTGDMIDDNLDVLIKDLAPRNPIDGETAAQAAFRALREDADMFNTIMQKIGTPAQRKALGELVDISPETVKELAEILKENGFDGDSLKLAQSIYKLQGNQLRAFTGDPSKIFNIFDKTPIKDGADAQVVRLMLPDFADVIEGSTAKKELLKEFADTQAVQTSRARYAREIKNILYEGASNDRERAFMDEAMDRWITKGKVSKELFDDSISLSRLPKELVGRLDEMIFSDSGLELPTFLKNKGVHLLVGQGFAKTQAEADIVKFYGELGDLADDVLNEKITKTEMLDVASYKYEDMIDDLARSFTRTTPVSISQALYKANKFYNPAYYGKAIDASTIMVQGFGSLLNKVDQSRELLDEVINTEKFTKWLGGPKITYREVIQNLTHTNVDNATDLAGAMYRNIGGKRTLIARGTGIMEGIISHSELLRQIQKEGSEISYLRDDKKALLKVLQGEDFIYSKVMREPSFPSPLGALMTRVSVVPDEVFGEMGIRQTDTLSATFINRSEIAAMLGDFDGDLVKQQFQKMGLKDADELAAGWMNQAQQLKRFFSMRLGEDGADALRAGWDNVAFVKEFEGRYVHVADPKGLDDNLFTKFLKSAEDKMMEVESMRVKAETYSVMQALTPRIGQMTKNVQSLFSGDEPAILNVIDNIRTQINSSNIDDTKNFLIEYGEDITGKSNTQIRQIGKRVMDSLDGAWGVLNSPAETYFKHVDRGLMVNEQSFTNKDLFIEWQSQGITQKGPIHKAKGAQLDMFMEWEDFVRRFYQGTTDDSVAGDLINYATSKRNVIQETRYDRMGVSSSALKGASDYMTEQEARIIQGSLKQNSVNTLSSVMRLMHAYRTTSGSRPLSEPFEMSKKPADAIYGWATDYMGDDIFIKPEISRLIAPTSRALIDSAESAAMAITDAVYNEQSSKRIFSETFSRTINKAFTSMAESRWGGRLALGALAFSVFDPNTNSILLPDQQYDGEKYDIPNLSELTRSYKNRFRARAEDSPAFVDKIASISGLPLTQRERPILRGGLPPKPNRPNYNDESGRAHNYLRMNDLKRQLGRIAYET